VIEWVVEPLLVLELSVVNALEFSAKTHYLLKKEAGVINCFYPAPIFFT
jgi:hypothetical protein